MSYDFGYPSQSPIIIIGEARYQALLEECTEGQRRAIELARERGEFIISPYLPDGTDAYIYTP